MPLVACDLITLKDEVQPTLLNMRGGYSSLAILIIQGQIELQDLLLIIIIELVAQYLGCGRHKDELYLVLVIITLMLMV
jgi:hypothetical protein